jgi:PLP dependent protein
LIQVNTSGEDSKSGLPPLTQSDTHPSVGESEIGRLAKDIITACPRLRMQGLMTIGALEQSLHASEGEKNADFERLKETKDVLQRYLVAELGEDAKGKWGLENRLVLSMGMSSDFEAALKAGSDIVRIGTGIFGERNKKTG